MRYCITIAVAFCLLLPCANAKDRAWQDAVFLGVQSTQTGAAAIPIGTAVVAVPLSSHHFWFKLGDLQYCLFFPSRLSGRIPNLTVNGHTKVAIEGRHMHVLDDDGKDWKLNIVEKVAPKEQ
jgi:hypothetical protein